MLLELLTLVASRNTTVPGHRHLVDHQVIFCLETAALGKPALEHCKEKYVGCLFHLKLHWLTYLMFLVIQGICRQILQ